MNDERTGFHPVHVAHLVTGVVLLGLVAVWGLWQGGTVSGDDVRWLMPVPWVAAGVVGLVASAITGARRHGTRQTGWVAPGETTEQHPQDQPTTAYETETEEQP